MNEIHSTARDGKEESQLLLNEGVIGYNGAHFVLVGRQEEMEDQVLIAGDVLELGASGSSRQGVHVASGGYRGWYYITVDGQRARFALCMRARLLKRAA
jgi:hypothetical protein